jgi:hypothetical protein
MIRTLAAILVICSIFGWSACVADQPLVTRRSAVIGGSPDTFSQYPQVGVLTTLNGIPFTCSGTLVTESVVVTAAHCLSMASQGELIFSTEWSAADGPATYDAVRGYLRSPQYDPSGASNIHDIGVVFLSTGMPGVSLPVLNSAPVNIGDVVELVGYGRTTSDGGVGIRSFAQSSISAVDISEMEVGSTGSARNCEGDSGGPSLLTDNTGALRLAGVVSRAADNTDTTCSGATIHTRVDSHLDWLRSVIAQDSAGGCSMTSARFGRRSSAGIWMVFACTFLQRRRRRASGRSND